MLSEKYRPREWSEFVGQAKAIKRIQAVLGLPGFDRGAFVLTGPSGSGKTSAARVIAESLGCSELDILTVESRECNLSAMRDAERFLGLCAWSGNGYRCVIIDEAHQADQRSRDYMLGLLERLPRGACVVATSTDPECFDRTLFSRWYAIEFAKPNAAEVEAHMRTIAVREGLDLSGIPDLKRFVHERHGNIRACLMDLEVEAAVMAAAA